MQDTASHTPGAERRREALDEPMEVSRVGDEIAIIGPDGAALSLTLEAAAESARRLAAALGEEADASYQKPLG